MCEMASFLYRPDNGDIVVYDLTGHGGTQKKLGLTEPLWCEGHYLPSGEIKCRTPDKNKEIEEKNEEHIRNRFPTFISFFMRAIAKDDIISSDGFDLRGLTTLPDGIVFPENVSGSLYLSSLTTLPDGIVFPENMGGYLDLRSLTTLPDGIVFPENMGGSLILSKVLKKKYYKK